MFCSSCGAEVKGKFCSECGTPAAQPETQPTAPVQEVSVCTTESQPKSILANLAAKASEHAKESYEKSKEAKALRKEQELQEKLELQERIKKMDREGIPYCPKCYSANLTSNKKGFGFGKAAVGAALTFYAGGIGAAAGGIGSGKITLTCLKCGHQFKPGKR